MAAEESARIVREVRLIPLRGVSDDRAEGLTARVSRRVSVPCVIERASIDLSGTRIEGRDQLDADEILRRVEELPPAPEAIRVALMADDAGIPIFTFVFGRARLGGGACVVSLARLGPEFYGMPEDPVLADERAVREILHEAAHVGGLEHCRDAACLMHFVGTVEAVDTRGGGFCPRCSEKLPAAFRRRAASGR